MSRDISQGIDPSMQYLSSGFNNNSAETTLSRMLGKEAPAKAQFCAECGTKIETAYRPPNAAANAEAYCKEHYEQLFAQTCDGCNKPIMGQYVNANGKKYHEQCHSQDKKCASCSQMIFGEALQACGKNYHPKCFKCTLCYTPLGTDFMQRSGYPYCNKCINEPPATSVKVPPEQQKEKQQKNQEIQENNVSKKEFQSNLQKGKMFCAECGNVIGVGEAITHNESTFHIKCFVCVKCTSQLVECGFKDINGEPHCPSCAGSSGSTGGFCAGCGKKLSGQFVNAMGQKWHRDCFVCVSCKKPFTTGYAEKNGEPYCSNCISKSSKPTVHTQVLGERKAGFTIDPRTGQKKYT